VEAHDESWINERSSTFDVQETFMTFASPRFNRHPDLAKAADNRPALKFGARGEAVKILQRALADLGFLMTKSTKNFALDGDFGKETETRVKDFQRSRGLVVDGVVGRLTMAALDQTMFALEETQRLEARASATALAPFGNSLIT
jgi:peptidoglycan hydrolase-like protein with peptidoglycan-binding domain